VAFDLWTMQAGIQFDNVLLTPSEEEARTLAERLWKPKHLLEEALEAEASRKLVRMMSRRHGPARPRPAL
jgi:hypothetical protein